jgi:hypothetical protein
MTQTNNDDHADALAAMAAGQSVGDDAAKQPDSQQPQDQQPQSQQAQDPQPPPPLPPEQQPLGQAAFGEPATPVSAQTYGVRQARGAINAARVQRERFMKTIMPAILVVGGLLILVALFGVYKLLTTRGFGIGFKTVVLASFLVGALLLLGAWWMHRDVSKSKRR